MVQLLNYIVNCISSLFYLGAGILTFVIHGFTSLLYLIGQIPLFLEYIASALVILPAWLLPFAFASLYISIFRWIINR